MEIVTQGIHSALESRLTLRLAEKKESLVPRRKCESACRLQIEARSLLLLRLRPAAHL